MRVRSGIRVIGAAVSLLLLTGGWLRGQDRQREAVTENLARLESLYQGVLPWLARLYDPASGGFYETLSLREGREPGEYGPDIQSTYFAIQILSQAGLLSEAPAPVRAKLVEYFQSRQDRQTGYFVDHDYPGMVDNLRVMGRALQFSTNGLDYLKAEPLYPLPGQSRSSAAPQASPDGKALSPPKVAPEPVPGSNAKPAEETSAAPQPKKSGPPNAAPEVSMQGSRVVTALSSKSLMGSAPTEPVKLDGTSDASPSWPVEEGSNVPAFLTSREALIGWLDGRPWDFAWTALDHISAQAQLIMNQPPALREAATEVILTYVIDRQDPQTGLVGGGPPEVRLSGGFKLVAFCQKLHRPVPRAEVLQQTVIEWFRQGPETDRIFFIRNTCEMLGMLVRQTGQPLTEEELADVVGVAVVELERFRQPDGSFSTYPDRFYICPNDLYLGKNKITAQDGPQSDLNATSSAMAARRSLYRLADRPKPALQMPDFWRVAQEQ